MSKKHRLPKAIRDGLDASLATASGDGPHIDDLTPQQKKQIRLWCTSWIVPGIRNALAYDRGEIDGQGEPKGDG